MKPCTNYMSCLSWKVFQISQTWKSLEIYRRLLSKINTCILEVFSVLNTFWRYNLCRSYFDHLSPKNLRQELHQGSLPKLGSWRCYLSNACDWKNETQFFFGAKMFTFCVGWLWLSSRSWAGEGTSQQNRFEASALKLSTKFLLPSGPNPKRETGQKIFQFDPTWAWRNTFCNKSQFFAKVWRQKQGKIGSDWWDRSQWPVATYLMHFFCTKSSCAPRPVFVLFAHNNTDPYPDTQKRQPLFRSRFSWHFHCRVKDRMTGVADKTTECFFTGVDPRQGVQLSGFSSPLHRFGRLWKFVSRRPQNAIQIAE